MSKLLITILAVCSVRAVYFFYKYLCARKYLKKYIEFTKITNNSTDGDKWYILEHQQDIVQLLKFAGIKNRQDVAIEPMGYGMGKTTTFNYFDNITSRRNDITTAMHRSLREAKSIFWRKIFQSLNPFYWIDFLIFLPKHILSYLEINTEGIIMKLFQVLWWFFSAIGILIGYWNEDFWNFILWK